MNVLVIPDPDEYVQTGRPLYVILVPEDKEELFDEFVLQADDGQEIREWLRLNGVRLADGVHLSKIGYVVSMW